MLEPSRRRPANPDGHTPPVVGTARQPWLQCVDGQRRSQPPQVNLRTVSTLPVRVDGEAVTWEIHEGGRHRRIVLNLYTQQPRTGAGFLMRIVRCCAP